MTNLNTVTSRAGMETTIRRWPSGCHFGGSGELWTVAGGNHNSFWSSIWRAKVFEFLNNHPKQQISFTNKTTLAWPTVQNSQTYQVYRANQHDIVDADADTDGLPDAGYGVCVSPVPPDDQNEFIIDSDEPLPGEAFTYVVGYKDGLSPLGGGGVKGGLGMTGDRKDRFVQVECP